MDWRSRQGGFPSASHIHRKGVITVLSNMLHSKLATGRCDITCYTQLALKNFSQRAGTLLWGYNMLYM